MRVMQHFVKVDKHIQTRTSSPQVKRSFSRDGSKPDTLDTCTKGHKGSYNSVLMYMRYRRANFDIKRNHYVANNSIPFTDNHPAVRP